MRIASPGPRTSGPVPAHHPMSVATSRRPFARFRENAIVHVSPPTETPKSSTTREPFGGNLAVDARAGGARPVGGCTSSDSCVSVSIRPPSFAGRANQSTSSAFGRARSGSICRSSENRTRASSATRGHRRHVRVPRDVDHGIVDRPALAQRRHLPLLGREAAQHLRELDLLGFDHVAQLVGLGHVALPPLASLQAMSCTATRSLRPLNATSRARRDRTYSPRLSPSPRS